MTDNLHPSHKWRFSDSSQYDEICDVCMVTENSPKAALPCTQSYGKDPIQISSLAEMKHFVVFGDDISEETKENIKAIDKNIQYAIMNAHKIWCD